MTERILTKVTITGYIDLSDDAERNFVLGDLMRIAYAMTEGAGIMTDTKEELIRATKLEEFPDEIQDFFQYMFEEEE